MVEAWLPAHESAFKDANGQPAPLWRVRYTTAGALDGELEDLEVRVCHIRGGGCTNSMGVGVGGCVTLGLLPLNQNAL